MQLSNPASATSSQAYRADDRNEQVLVYLNGDFVPRSEAKVSIFDAGYVCGDDPYEHKPSPAPYLAAAERLGIAPEDMVKCVVMEDSSSGLRSGAASGATLIAQTGWIRTDTSGLGQFASIDSYEGIDAAALDAFVRQRLGE